MINSLPPARAPPTLTSRSDGPSPAANALDANISFATTRSNSPPHQTIAREVIRPPLFPQHLSSSPASAAPFSSVNRVGTQPLQSAVPAPRPHVVTDSAHCFNVSASRSPVTPSIHNSNASLYDCDWLFGDNRKEGEAEGQPSEEGEQREGDGSEPSEDDSPSHSLSRQSPTPSSAPSTASVSRLSYCSAPFVPTSSQM